METWELWYPEGAAAGIAFSRSKIDPTDSVLVHAAPPNLEVVITDAAGRQLARSGDLRRTVESPMCRLVRRGGQVTREDLWPTEESVGDVVLLFGGEAGRLLR